MRGGVRARIRAMAASVSGDVVIGQSRTHLWLALKEASVVDDLLEKAVVFCTFCDQRIDCRRLGLDLWTIEDARLEGATVVSS